jgi:hypothetical protein
LRGQNLGLNLISNSKKLEFKTRKIKNNFYECLEIYTGKRTSRGTTHRSIQRLRTMICNPFYPLKKLRSDIFMIRIDLHKINPGILAVKIRNTSILKSKRETPWRMIQGHLTNVRKIRILMNMGSARLSRPKKKMMRISKFRSESKIPITSGP